MPCEPRGCSVPVPGCASPAASLVNARSMPGQCRGSPGVERTRSTAPAAARSGGSVLMRKICISGAFFMCQDAWTNQQHITLAKNEMLTNVDISNLIDT